MSITTSGTVLGTRQKHNVLFVSKMVCVTDVSGCSTGGTKWVSVTCCPMCEAEEPRKEKP